MFAAMNITLFLKSILHLMEVTGQSPFINETSFNCTEVRHDLTELTPVMSPFPNLLHDRFERAGNFCLSNRNSSLLGYWILEKLSESLGHQYAEEVDDQELVFTCKELEQEMEAGQTYEQISANATSYCEQLESHLDPAVINENDFTSLNRELICCQNVFKYPPKNVSSEEFINEGEQETLLGREPNDFLLPWKHCRLVINEVNTDTPDGIPEQFIELTQICKEGKFSQRIALDGFRLLIVNGKERTVIVSKLLDGFNLSKYQIKKRRYRYFTVGADLVSKVDVKFRDIPVADNWNIIPSGFEYPYAIVLIFSATNAFVELDLPVIDGVYQAIPLTADLINILKENLQDILVFGSTPQYQTCSIFSEIYPPFSSGNSNYLLRDFQTNPNAPDRSLNRCTKSFLPIVVNSFRYAYPTPGLPNDCDNSFPFIFNEHINDVSDVLQAAIGTNPTDPGCSSTLYGPLTYRSVDMNRLEEAVEVAEQSLSGQFQNVEILDDANVALEVDINDDVMEQDVPTPLTHTYQCNHNNPFDKYPLWRETISSFQQDVIDTNTVEDCKVKPWFWYNINEDDKSKSTYSCMFCIQAMKKGKLPVRPGKITKIMTEEGALVSSGNRQKRDNSHTLLRHSDDPFHKLATHYIMETEWHTSEAELSAAIEEPESEIRKYYRATERVIAGVYKAVKLNLSFEQYEGLMKFVRHYYEVDVGVHFHDSQSMQKIAMTISDKMHEQLLNHLLTVKPLISIIVDASEDIGGKHYLTVLFQTFDKRDRPHVFFYKLLQIKVDQGAKDLFKLVLDAIRNDGLYDYFKEQLVGYSSDGASVLKTAFLRLLKAEFGQRIIGVHCSAHRLDLVTKHAFKKFPYLLHLDSIINDQFNYLGSRSLKLQAKLEEIVEELDDRSFRLHRLYPIRWISSKYVAIKNILNHWKTIMVTYTSIQNGNEFTNAQKRRARDLQNELRFKPVISTLAFVEDVCEIFRFISLEFQRERSNPINFKEFKENIRNKLLARKYVEGAVLQNILNGMVCIRNGIILNPCLLSVFEKEDVDVTYNGEDVVHIDDPDYPVLSECRDNYIDAIITELDKYFPDDFYDNFSIFNPKHFPLPGTDWNNYGYDEIIAIKNQFRFQGSDNVVVNDWEKLIVSIVGRRPLFMSKRDLSVEDFWYYYLNHVVDVEWTDLTRLIIKAVLAIPGGTASAERTFSLVSVVKTHKRSLLSPEMVEALVRIKYNGPDEVEKVHMFEYVKEWCKTHSTADDMRRSSYRIEDYLRKNEVKTVHLFPPSIF